MKSAIKSVVNQNCLVILTILALEMISKNWLAGYETQTPENKICFLESVKETEIIGVMYHRDDVVSPAPL